MHGNLCGAIPFLFAEIIAVGGRSHCHAFEKSPKIEYILLISVRAVCYSEGERDQLIAVLLQTFIAAADRGEKYLTLPLLLQIWKSTLCGEELSSVPDLKRHLRIRQLLPRKVAQTSVVILCMRNRGRNH